MYKDNPLLPDKDTAIFNKKKDGMTPDEAGMKLRRRPIKPGFSYGASFWLPENIPPLWQPYVQWLLKKQNQ